MKKEKINRIIEIAKEKFLENDKDLFLADVNERSMTHKFAEYLQQFFGCNWNVDCEYNRYGQDTKKVIEEIVRIVGKDTLSSDTEAKTIYPDIIVHKRGKNGPNLLVIEAKKDASIAEQNKDTQKIKKIKGMYKYKFAVFLNFKITKNFDIDFKFV